MKLKVYYTKMMGAKILECFPDCVACAFEYVEDPEELRKGRIILFTNTPCYSTNLQCWSPKFRKRIIEDVYYRGCDWKESLVIGG